MLPAWANRPASEITRGDVRGWVNKVASTISNKGTPLSSTTVATIRNDATSFFTWAEAIEAITISPFAGLRLIKAERALVKKHTDLVYLKSAELARVWRACDDYTAQGGNPVVGGIIKLTMLTGLRKSNVAGLRHNEIQPSNFRNGHDLVFSAERMKMDRPFILPLTPIMLEVLDAVPRSGELVFPQRLGNPSMPFEFGNRHMRAIRDLSGVETFNLKRLRTTLTTLLVNQRDRNGDLISRDSVEEVCGRETRRGAEKAYQASDFYEPKLQALDVWSQFIVETINPAVIGS